jgi:hypothetical protein
MVDVVKSLGCMRCRRRDGEPLDSPLTGFEIASG